MILPAIAATLFNAALGAAAPAEGPHTLRLANPGEWVHIQIKPVAGDERAIYEIWDDALEANGFYQVAVPTKSGNRSVRHVAYNPQTKARFKYHILFDLGYRLKMQFEGYDGADHKDLVEIAFDMRSSGTAAFEFIAPEYCHPGKTPGEINAMSTAARLQDMEDHGCDTAAYREE